MTDQGAHPLVWPFIVSVIFLLAVAVGKLLKRAGTHYPEARR